MARGSGTVTIRIVGEAAGLKSGLDDADKHLSGFGAKVDGFASKMGDFGKKMTVGVSLPIVGALALATKAAVDDEAAQATLAKTLENTVGATKGVVAGVESYIAGAMKASTFTDDELRPAFANLVRETRNVKEAQDLMRTAMDLAAAKGISVEEASMALVKAHNGQTKALAALGVETKNAEGEAVSFAEVMRDTNEVVGGQAAAATETAAGKTKMMARDMGELTESIGTALIPILTSLLDIIRPVIDKFTSMDSGTQKIIVIVGLAVAAIGPLITIIGGLTTALTFLAANPVVLIIAGIALLVAGLVIAYQKSEAFRDIVNRVFEFLVNAIGDYIGFILDYFATWIGGFATVAEAAAKIPIIGEHFRGVADAVRDAEHTVRGWADTAHTGIDLVTNDAERLKKSLSGLAMETGNLLSGATRATGTGTAGPLPRRAAGGPVSAGRSYLVGERGAEVFTPGASGGISPNVGGAGGGPLVVQVVLDRRVIGQVTVESLRDLQRRSGNLGLTAAPA